MEGKSSFFLNSLGKDRRRHLNPAKLRMSLVQRQWIPFYIPFFGDVEWNSGSNNSKTSKAASKEESLDFSEIFLRFEQKMESGQENIIRNHTQMLNRLSSLKIQYSKTKNVEQETTVYSLSETIANNYDHGKDSRL